MTATVEMRVLGGDADPLPLEFLKDREPYIVMVPGFGALIIGRFNTNEDAHLIARLGSLWGALLVQPDGDGRFGPSSAKVARDTVEVETDGSVEIELLPNSSGEERLVVVLHPADA